MKHLKPVLLLSLAFFLASAPSPDADLIAEITANFIVPEREFTLHASMLGESQRETIQAIINTD